MNEQLRHRLFAAGTVLLILSSLAYFFEVAYAEYSFALGALLVLIQQFAVMLSNPSNDIVIKRRRRLELYVAFMPAVGAYSMFEGTTLWIPMLMLFALLTLFLSYRK